MNNSKNFIWLGGLSLILLSTLIAFVFPNQQFGDFVESVASDGVEEEGGEYRPLSWKLLQKLDYKNNITPPELSEFIDKRIRLPGFAVPLSSDFHAIEEFLLVPNQLACIHVPPPPPNLMLYVYVKKPVTLEDISGPLWLEGTLSLKETKSVYGAASWEVHADKISPYEMAP